MPSIENPNQSIPDEVASTYRDFNKAQRETLARQGEIDRLSRSTTDERNVINEIRQASAFARGINPDMLGRLREINDSKASRLKAALDAADVAGVFQSPWTLDPLDPAPPAPPPADPTFWWARTDWWVDEEGLRANSLPDGLYFSGGVSRHNGDFHRNSFGAVALFGLQPERIPSSPTGRWQSSPYVELKGGLLAHTGSEDIFTGDLWSKCWQHLDQQIYQVTFGPDGPVPIILSQQHRVDNIFNEADGDRTVRAGTPGFLTMPSVIFGNINPNLTLWARVEVLFDIQTEGAGSLMWLDPYVLLRTFQWPLVALK